MTAQDLYASVTNQIVAALEAGNVAPWRQRWTTGSSFLPLRHNGSPYRGINTVILWMQQTECGFSSPHWMTFKQCSDYGGNVKRGAKSTPILFCQPMTKLSAAADGSESKDSFWISKSYRVFNAQQCEGLPERFTAAHSESLSMAHRIENADTFIGNTGAEIEHTGYAAYYAKLSDRITIPPFKEFETEEAYYSTSLHELAHWTGAPHRLARFNFEKSVREEYAKEEVTAELAACFLTAQLGISNIVMPDHHAYLDFWLTAMKSDPKYIFQAASKAQQAADFLNNLQPKTEA